MKSSINKKKISSKEAAINLNSQEEDLLKYRRRVFDMNEIKRAKIFRNEVIDLFVLFATFLFNQMTPELYYMFCCYKTIILESILFLSFFFDYEA
jgi:hypothetical protein